MRDAFKEYLSWFDGHEEEYIRDLGDYVSFPSVARKDEDGYPFGKGCHDMLFFMRDIMLRYGLDEARIIRDVFAEGTIRGRGKNKRRIAVACHGDVVPVGEGWDSDPFTMYRKADHLVGRGTTDNKGAGMAVLYALRYLVESGYRPYNDIVLLVGSSEETGMEDVRIAGDSLARADITLVPDSGFPLVYGEKASGKASFRLGLEPVGLKAFDAFNGVSVIDRAEAVIASDKEPPRRDRIDVVPLVPGEYRITASGLGRHPATPEDGIDASLLLAGYLVSEDLLPASEKAVFQKLLGLFPDFWGTGLGIRLDDPESGKSTAVLRKVRLEDGALDAEFGFKLPLSANPDKMFEVLRAAVPDIVIDDGFTRGWKYELDDTCMRLNDIANEVWEADRKPQIMAGGTYARYLQPAIVYGMGSPHGNVQPPFPPGQGRAHQRNESVHLLRMEKGFAIYVEALKLLDEIFGEGGE
ncbi:MAG: M20/M25/M40 family metallo-hydrolase [Sphaerochaetaceae bacterium]|nr:M20/M25/M40 family metallo-hydrolase [Sphaerochaetaceae bacterium]